MGISSTNRKSQFAHFLNHTTGELEYRLMQVLEVCSDSLRQFNVQSKYREDSGLKLNYRFAAFSSLVQTLKDILPVLTDDKVSWSSLSCVRHVNFIRQSRNAITHDGNPIINLWAEGRYYVACDFVRLNQHGSSELVTAPVEDIATICLEFTFDLASKIRLIIEPFSDENEFVSPMYGVEFFDQAIEHPAVPNFAKDLYKNSAIKSNQLDSSSPLDKVCQKLEKLATNCNLQLKTKEKA